MLVWIKNWRFSKSNGKGIYYILKFNSIRITVSKNSHSRKNAARFLKCV